MREREMIINYTLGENYTYPFTKSGALMEARKSNLKSPFPTIAMIYTEAWKYDSPAARRI